MYHFIRDWFQNPSWWFEQSPVHDAYITEKYGSLLDEDWSEEYPVIGRVLIWDQLPRHVFRGQAAAHIVEFFLQKALLALQKYGDFDDDDGDIKMTDEEFMFMKLPYRHTRQYAHVLPVMYASWDRIQHRAPSETSTVMRKFIRAMYANHPTNDQAYMVDRMVDDVDLSKDVAPFKQILDYDGVIKLEDEAPRDMGDFDCLQMHSAMIVSLSGGVDSMVALDVVRRKYPHVDVAAVHINYDNRETSKMEEDFVTWWCFKNNIPLYVRRITEIHRGPCMEYGFRDVYESYTKRVRFGTYETVWKMMGQRGIPSVLLGHNEDDCFENILTNTTQKAKYDDLRGMKKWSEQDGVRFFRPMLVIPKKKITQYAQSMGIPYLYDSTPSWSQRGKIRDKVVPTLNEWNPQCVHGLLELATMMTQLFTVLRSNVEEWIASLQKEDGHSSKIVTTLPTCELFWRDFFVRAFKILPSNKSLHNFITRMQHLEQHHEVNVPYKLVLHKEMTVVIVFKKNKSIQLQFRDPQVI